MVHPARVEMYQCARERKGAVYVSAKGAMVLLASVKRASAFVTKTVVPSDGACKWNTYMYHDSIYHIYSISLSCL